MESREFTNIIREKAKDLKMAPEDLESAAGQMLTDSIQERIKGKEPEEQLMSVVILLATIMCCFNISPEMFRDEHFLEALERAQEMLKELPQ